MLSPSSIPQREGGALSTKCTMPCAEWKLTCFALVIEIANRIIVGVQANKPMSASTKQNSKNHISGTADEGMGHWRPSEH